MFYRLYHKLPEVQERQKILQRQELYAKNRERAKSYHQVTSYCGTVFDKLIWCTIGPKSFLFGTAQLSFWASGTVKYDYIVTNSLY